MWKTPAASALVLSLGTLVLTPAPAAAADDAKAVVENASLAMGAAGLNSITYSGSAANGNFGQSRTISFGLASTTIRNYTRTIDFTQPASHAIRRPHSAGRSRRSAAATRRAGQLRSADHAGERRVGAAAADLGHAVGISARRGRQHNATRAHEEGRRRRRTG